MELRSIGGTRASQCSYSSSSSSSKVPSHESLANFKNWEDQDSNEKDADIGGGTSHKDPTIGWAEGQVPHVDEYRLILHFFLIFRL